MEDAAAMQRALEQLQRIIWTLRQGGAACEEIVQMAMQLNASQLEELYRNLGGR